VDADPDHHGPRARRLLRHERLLAAAYRDGMVCSRNRRRDRDAAWQLQRRERERRLRLRCLALARWARWNGWHQQRFLAVLGIEPRTLWGWQALVGQAAKPQGAPPMRATPRERREVGDFVTLWNRCCSLRDLCEHFPHLPRNELAHLYWAFVTAQRQEHALCLRWTAPGTVWAIDYSHADHPIDGVYPFLLVVRDLASGYQLATLPCYRATAAQVVALLQALFHRHGPPLVLKSDNGSHFVNAAVEDLLARHGVTLLLSPPYYPRYNGACEAGIGACKVRIHHRATRDGDPTRWTSDHVEAARCDANHRDWAGSGAPPTRRWEAARHISPEERHDFLAAVAADIRHRQHEADRLPLDRRPPDHTIRRKGIADALVGIGYLQYRSRSVHQPVMRENLA
jgi:transposase InsO family protein